MVHSAMEETERQAASVTWRTEVSSLGKKARALMCAEKVEEAKFGQTHENQKKKTFRKWTIIEESTEYRWM